MLSFPFRTNSSSVIKGEGVGEADPGTGMFAEKRSMFVGREELRHVCQVASVLFVN